MYTQILTIALCLSALAVASPVPNNPINSTIANIENYFGNLAQSLISRREVNSTEKLQSADGHTQVSIQPVGATTLQEILFHPSNLHLVAENDTKLFSNDTEEVHLAKVDLVTESTTEHRETSESTTKSPASTTASHETTEAATTSSVSTTTVQILKAIPTTVVTGTTESTAVADLSTKAISSTVTDSTSSSSSTTVSTPISTPLVEIVTPVNEAAANGTSITTAKAISRGTTSRTPTSTAAHVEIVTPVNVVANATSTTTAEPESESKEIRDKVKEVEAEPVILTVGV